LGIKLVALRCAGFNNVDLSVAEELEISVCRVPAYSPYAVAEHAITLMTSLNRRIPQAWAKTRTGNFSLEGQLGFDMTGKKVGVIGTGKIGQLAAGILKKGYECDVIAYDVFQSPVIKEMGIKYVELDELFRTADVITVHAPLMPATHHMVNREAIEKMKPGVFIVNTSRGGLIDTKALIWGLKQKIVGGAGLDVFEEEADYFFNDYSNKFVDNDDFARLLSNPNVIITAHQAFFTKEALTEIAKTTLNNIVGFYKDGVTPKQHGFMDTMVKAQ
jgi:D-lactate dehydrogenase